MRRKRVRSWQFMVAAFLCFGLVFAIFWKFAVPQPPPPGLWDVAVSEAKEKAEAPLFLAYHYVRNRPAPGPNCPPERLQQQLKLLLSEGYEILTCGEIARRMINNIPLPRKYASLSFDDGLKDHYTNAFSILQEFGVSATFFVITCTLNNEIPPVIGLQILIDRLGAKRMESEILPKMLADAPYSTLLDPTRYDIRDAKSGEAPEVRRIKWVFNHFPSAAFKQDLIARMFAEYLGKDAQKKIASEWFLSPEEISEMSRCGMEIASHSHSHPPLDISGLDEIEWEMIKSKTRLTRLLSKVPATFGWPFGGKFRPEVKQLALRHYLSAWNYLPGNINIMPAPPYKLGDIPRLNEKNLKMP